MTDASEMKCSCGGTLSDDYEGRRQRALKLLPKHPRWSRNRRIAKKQRKKYAERPDALAMLFVAHFPSRPPGWKCNQCGRMEGFYSGIGKNLIQIQPMPTPPGALFYLDYKYEK